MIYLDNAATTRVYNSAAREANEAMNNLYANPSSLHSMGIASEELIDKSRNIIAAAAGVDKREIYFCSGGTMANNTAIFGYLASKKRGRIITSEYEHPSVLECFKKLEDTFEVIYLRPVNGVITPETLEKNLTDDTLLASIMHVNNETGDINNINALITVLKNRCPDAVFHTDAVQSFLKEDFGYRKADMASFSAHKTHVGFDFVQVLEL